MALSDWNLLSFGPDAQPTTGSFTDLQTGANVRIYKDRILVEDPRLSYKGRDNERPQAVIQSGSMQIANFQIDAAQHDFQDAVFVLATYYDAKTGSAPAFAGIGASAYLNLFQWYERNDPSFLEGLPAWFDHQTHLWSLSHRSEAMDDDTIKHQTFLSIYGFEEDGTEVPKDEIGMDWGDYRKGILEYALYEDGEEEPDRFTGITQELYDAFAKWLREQAAKGQADSEWVERVLAAKPLQLNQGDMFFAAHGETSMADIAYPLGQVAEPRIMAKIATLTPEQLATHPIAIALKEVADNATDGN